MMQRSPDPLTDHIHQAADRIATYITIHGNPYDERRFEEYWEKALSTWKLAYDREKRAGQSFSDSSEAAWAETIVYLLEYEP